MWAASLVAGAGLLGAFATRLATAVPLRQTLRSLESLLRLRVGGGRTLSATPHVPPRAHSATDEPLPAMSVASLDVSAPTQLAESPKLDGPLRRVLTEEHHDQTEIAHFSLLIDTSDLEAAEEVVRAAGGEVVRSARWGRGTMRLQVTSPWNALPDLERASEVRELGLTKWFAIREAAH